MAANLTTKDVARLLLISEATVKSWLRKDSFSSLGPRFAEMRATAETLSGD